MAEHTSMKSLDINIIHCHFCFACVWHLLCQFNHLHPMRLCILYGQGSGFCYKDLQFSAADVIIVTGRKGGKR